MLENQVAIQLRRLYGEGVYSYLNNIEVIRWIIITKDEEDTISEQDIQIEVIPAWKWLCI